MYKKRTTLLLICLTQSYIVNANEHNSPTESTISTPNINLSEECQKLFDAGNKLIIDVTKQNGTHIEQLEQMKSKLNIVKKKILNLDAEMQQKSCHKGLIELERLKQKNN